MFGGVCLQNIVNASEKAIQRQQWGSCLQDRYKTAISENSLCRWLIPERYQVVSSSRWYLAVHRSTCTVCKRHKGMFQKDGNLKKKCILSRTDNKRISNCPWVIYTSVWILNNAVAFLSWSTVPLLFTICVCIVHWVHWPRVFLCTYYKTHMELNWTMMSWHQYYQNTMS